MDIAQFVGETTLQMISDGVAVRAHPENTVTGESDGIVCSGYFDPEGKVFVCSMGRAFWPETWAHEFCHYTQWKDGFMDQFDDEIIWDWLGGNDYSFEAVEKSVRGSQELEADNERRTVEVIKKYDLPIDLEAYRQKSNAYIMFYDVVLKTRMWPTGTNVTYSDPAIYCKFPADRIMGDSEFCDAPPWFMEAVVSRMGEQKKPTLWQKLRRKVLTVYDPKHGQGQL